MKNLNNIRRTLLYFLSFVTFNILFDKFIFNEKLDAYHLGGAVFGGVGMALLFTYLYNRQKKKTESKSSSSQ